MMHDIGLLIGYPKHHKHTYYLIKSSLSGAVDPSELDLIANIARYHRKSAPNARHVAFSQLSPFQQDVVRKLGAILRVADALDYGHLSTVRDIWCKLRSARKLAIRLSGKGDLTREVDYALEKADMLNKVFNVDTIIDYHARLPVQAR